jgi:hypothetical protein
MRCARRNQFHIWLMPFVRLEVVFALGNNVEAFVELYVIALSIVTNHASHLVFIALYVQLLQAGAARGS